MEKVACRTPSEGRTGVTPIPAWKFDLIRAHIMAVVGADEIAFADLPARVRARLGPDEIARLGSVNWHVTTVKLELEMRGEIERTRARGPQRIRRVV